MLKIAIVDDMEKDRNNISNIAYKIGDVMGSDFDVRIFTSGFNLIESLADTTYDIILLDIQMDDIDGIEILKKIKTLDVESYIIFISSYNDRWKELFEEKVIGFISKSNIEMELTEKIKSVIDKLNNRKAFKYYKNGKKNVVLLNDILYFVSCKHYIRIHTRNEIVEYKGKTSEVWELLKENYCFFMPNRSSVVNFKYTNFISRAEIHVGKAYKYGSIMTITPKFRASADDRFMKYAEIIGN